MDISMTKTVLDAIAKMDRDELEAVFSAYKQRHRTLRETEALTNKVDLKPGTRVVTKGLKPKYLNGLHATVAEASFTDSGKRIPIVVDEAERHFAGRYISPATGRVQVPANCLQKVA